MIEEYTCSLCKETFDKEWSDEEANKECEEIWGVKNASTDDRMVVVCDECYKMMNIGQE